MSKPFLIVLLSCAMMLLTACGSSVQALAQTQPEFTAAPVPSENSAKTTVPENGHSPVMHYVGVYSSEYNTEALVEADGADGVKITVTWAGSPWFHNQTVMSGPFNPETLTMIFADAALTEHTYASDGSATEEKTGYTGGKGYAVFSPEGKP